MDLSSFYWVLLSLCHLTNNFNDPYPHSFISHNFALVFISFLYSRLRMADDYRRFICLVIDKQKGLVYCFWDYKLMPWRKNPVEDHWIPFWGFGFGLSICQYDAWNRIWRVWNTSKISQTYYEGDRMPFIHITLHCKGLLRSRGCGYASLRSYFI